MMEPLETSPMPTRAALIGINTANSWQAGPPQQPVRTAYIATNSTQRVAFISLQNARNPHQVLHVITRPSYFPDMPYGLVIELHLTSDIAAGETIYLSLAQAGATAYYPPQPIDDAK
jgi:hypothetical protein